MINLTRLMILSITNDPTESCEEINTIYMPNIMTLQLTKRWIKQATTESVQVVVSETLMGGTFDTIDK